jgi:signal transduction histidine kinase
VIISPELLLEIRSCCCDQAAFERLLGLLTEILSASELPALDRASTPSTDRAFADHPLLNSSENGFLGTVSMATPSSNTSPGNSAFGNQELGDQPVSNTPCLDPTLTNDSCSAKIGQQFAAPDAHSSDQRFQSERLMTLGQLMADTAHEINNPVSFAYGNLVHLQQYIRDLTHVFEQYRQQLQSLDPDRIAELKMIEQEVDLDFLLEDLPKTTASMKLGLERVRTILSSLKNFSRTDGKEPQACDLNESLTSSLLILHHRLKIRSDGVPIQITENYATLPPVECFIGQINQVFINIIGNAIDALEDYRIGEAFHPRIDVTTALNSTGDRVVISIVDNGPGIPETIQAQLFDRFFTTKPPGKGTGLGLAIVQEIITQNHRGEVICRSSSAGTTFEIQLPIRQKLSPAHTTS